MDTSNDKSVEQDSGSNGGPDVSQESVKETGADADWRDAELAKVRKEAATARINLRDYKKQVEETMILKSDLDSKLAEKDAELDKLKLQIDKETVARKHGLPDDVMEFLNGGTVEELEAQAVKLAGFAGKVNPSGPTPNPGGGFNPGSSESLEDLDPISLAEKIAPRRL